MDKLRNVANKIKKHVTDNKISYIMGGVAVGAIALQQRNRVAFYSFLEENGIDPEEYYCPESFAEKNG